MNGRDIAKEYFAIGDDGLRLIRIESKAGGIVQNEYVYPNFEIGLPPDATSEEEWAPYSNPATGLMCYRLSRS
jgi:hypothetical protein